MSQFEVIVGNIGTVYSGDNEATAREAWRSYRADSISHYGRASGEPVTLFVDGNILDEYLGETFGE